MSNFGPWLAPVIEELFALNNPFFLKRGEVVDDIIKAAAGALKFAGPI
jgi:hypothetical protein